MATIKIIKEAVDRLERRLQARFILAGEIVETDAKLLCPVDTGNLRSSIDSRLLPGTLEVRIGTAVEYAPFQELGTYKMRARPFLVPALRGNRNRIKQIIKGR